MPNNIVFSQNTIADNEHMRQPPRSISPLLVTLKQPSVDYEKFLNKCTFTLVDDILVTFWSYLVYDLVNVTFKVPQRCRFVDMGATLTKTPQKKSKGIISNDVSVQLTTHNEKKCHLRTFLTKHLRLQAMSGIFHRLVETAYLPHQYNAHR